MSGVVDIRPASAPGPHGAVPTRFYEPRTPDEGALPLVWVHGGAFSGGGLDQRESHEVALALAGHGRPVMTVGYSLVPAWSPVRSPRTGVLGGVRFPVPLDDVAAATEMAEAAWGRPVALGGASAGACLAAAAALRAAGQCAGLPATLLLVYGTFHAALPSATTSLRRRIRGWRRLGQFTPAVVDRMNRNYAGSLEAMADPCAFPGGHDLAGLPPTLVLDADHDALAASGESFAGELRAAGVDSVREVVAGTRHGFLDRPGSPQFALGIERMDAWLRH